MSSFYATSPLVHWLAGGFRYRVCFIYLARGFNEFTMRIVVQVASVDFNLEQWKERSRIILNYPEGLSAIY